MFIRKIAPEFPDKILRHYIYEYNKEKDNKLVLKEPFIMIMNRYSIFLKKYFNFYFLPLFIAIYIFYIMIL
jgi:hypothetical protein